jgi:hypothetical protein
MCQPYSGSRQTASGAPHGTGCLVLRVAQDQWMDDRLTTSGHCSAAKVRSPISPTSPIVRSASTGRRRSIASATTSSASSASSSSFAALPPATTSWAPPFLHSFSLPQCGFHCGQLSPHPSQMRGHKALAEERLPGGLTTAAPSTLERRHLECQGCSVVDAEVSTPDESGASE